jgi:hypothetical protein
VSNIEKLEFLLGVTYYSRTYEIDYFKQTKVTYYFGGGILYKNLQVLLKRIGRGLDCDVVFERSVYKYTQDGILQQPRLISVNGECIVSDGIYVSWNEKQ